MEYFLPWLRKLKKKVLLYYNKTEGRKQEEKRAQ